MSLGSMGITVLIMSDQKFATTAQTILLFKNDFSEIR